MRTVVVIFDIEIDLPVRACIFVSGKYEIRGFSFHFYRFKEFDFQEPRSLCCALPGLFLRPPPGSEGNASSSDGALLIVLRVLLLFRCVVVVDPDVELLLSVLLLLLLSMPRQAFDVADGEVCCCRSSAAFAIMSVATRRSSERCCQTVPAWPPE